MGMDGAAEGDDIGWWRLHAALQLQDQSQTTRSYRTSAISAFCKGPVPLESFRVVLG